MHSEAKVILQRGFWVIIKWRNWTINWRGGKVTVSYILSDNFGPKLQQPWQAFSLVVQVGGLVGPSWSEINQESRSTPVWTNLHSLSRPAMVRCLPSTPSLSITFFLVFFGPFLFLFLCLFFSLCNLFCPGFPWSRKSLRERRHCSDGSAWKNTVSDHGCTWISLLQVKRFRTQQKQRANSKDGQMMFSQGPFYLLIISFLLSVIISDRSVNT